MSLGDPLWGDAFEEPIFALTADQDWAPEWAMERFLDFAGEVEVPVHVFVTNESPALDRTARDGAVTVGAHPNFLAGSSHGATPEDVIATCRSLVPEAATFRSHALREDAHVLALLLEAGFHTDSNLSLFLQPGIVPLIHSTGMLLLPGFLDDDSLLLWDREGRLDLDPIAPALASPGLKILNFHPILFAINCPSLEYYAAHRDALYRPDSTAPVPFEGRGTATVLRELIAGVRDEGARLHEYLEIADQAREHLRAASGERFYAWPR